jgi:NAD(P)-dependent dehydrogenase (short-subunit alcohol dehydrogenase family)
MSREYSRHSKSAPRRARREFLQRAAAVLAATAGSAIAGGSLTTRSAMAADGAAPPPDKNHKTPLADVTGKVAFITGGSSGIGLGMVRAFAAAGMKVAFTYLNDAHRDETLAFFKDSHAEVHAIHLDVMDRDAMVRAADEAQSVFGKVHLLCNNAGIGLRAGAATATYKDWDWGLGVNLGGIINGVTTFVPRIRAHGEGGHIMATSSSAGLVAGGKVGVYVTSKFAVVGMMESLREELDGENIGVSVYCPGLVRSNIVQSERNRPAELANDAAKTNPPLPPSPADQSAMQRFFAASMDPLEAGELVLRGIRQNDLYILTHQEFETVVRERSEALLASFPTEPAPRERVEIVRTYTTDIYRRERDRKLAQRRRSKHHTT